MQNYNAKFKIIKIIFLVFIFHFSFFIFNLGEANADELKSTNYRLEWTNLNMTSGKESSSDYTMTDTVGQTVEGRYSSSGYLVRAGFQYLHSIVPFTFSLSKTSINFGGLTPNNPLTDSALLTVNSGEAKGYRVTVSQDNQLRKNPKVFIPDVVCDDGNCNEIVAKPWILKTTYGFGYSLSGEDIPKTFLNNNYFRSFPSKADGEAPITIMSSTTVARNKQATITFKVNVSDTQEPGQYRNIVSFVATPSY